MDVSREVSITKGLGFTKVACPCGYITTFSDDFIIDPELVATRHNNAEHNGEYGVYNTLESHNE